jgi:hypothetical protein
MATSSPFSTEHVLEARAGRVAPRLAFRATTRPRWEARRVALVAKNRELRRVPVEPPVPLNPRIVEVASDQGFPREKVAYDTMDGVSVPAWPLLPERAAAVDNPAALAPHGDLFGRSAVLGLPVAYDWLERQIGPGAPAPRATSDEPGAGTR